MNKKLIQKVALVIAASMPFACLAAPTGGIQGLATNLLDQIVAIANVLVIVSYVAGVGFALAGIVQFKAHKDAPTQVPLSKPIVYLVVGACLLFLPSIIDTAGQTIFGDKGTEALKKEFKRGGGSN